MLGQATIFEDPLLTSPFPEGLDSCSEILFSFKIFCPGTLLKNSLSYPLGQSLLLTAFKASHPGDGSHHHAYCLLKQTCKAHVQTQIFGIT